MIQLMVTINEKDDGETVIQVAHRGKDEKPGESLHRDILVESIRRNMEEFLQKSGGGSIVEHKHEQKTELD